MPRHITLGSLPIGWTQATGADVTALRIQNSGSFEIRLQRGTEAAPASLAGALTLRPGQVLPADVEIAVLWPGIGGARVWIWSDIPQGGVSISHA